MEQQRILEGNIELVKLEGAKIKKGKGEEKGCLYAKHNGTTLNVDLLQYYTDWNWLMPVYTHIDSLAEISIESNVCLITFGGTYSESSCCMVNNVFETTNNEGQTLIESVWIACVEFAKFYNERTMKQKLVKS